MRVSLAKSANAVRVFSPRPSAYLFGKVSKQTTIALQRHPTVPRLLGGLRGDLDWTVIVQLWDIESGQELFTLAGQGSRFWPTAFFGNTIATMNYKRLLHFRRVPNIGSADG
jgi:hypothetical protein